MAHHLHNDEDRQMAKFKVGDRVRYTGDIRRVRGLYTSEELRPGMIGTVTCDDDCPYVSWDSITCGHNGDSSGYPENSQWAVFEYKLELI